MFEDKITSQNLAQFSRLYDYNLLESELARTGRPSISVGYQSVYGYRILPIIVDCFRGDAKEYEKYSIDKAMFVEYNVNPRWTEYLAPPRGTHISRNIV